MEMTRDDTQCPSHSKCPLSADVVTRHWIQGILLAQGHHHMAVYLFPPSLHQVPPWSLLSGPTVQGVTSDYGAAGQTMEQSVLGSWMCWGRQRLEKAKLSCPRGLRAGSEIAVPDQAPEEANREMDWTKGGGENSTGNPTDARRGGMSVQCRQESRRV